MFIKCSHGNFLKSLSKASSNAWVCGVCTISSSKSRTGFLGLGCALRTWLLLLGCALRTWLLLWGVPLRKCLAQEAAWQGIREAVRGVHGPRCDHLSWTVYLMLLYFSIDLPEESQSQTAASNFACFYLLNFFVISGIFSLMLSIRYIKKFLGLFPKAQISRCLCRPSDLSIWGQKPGMLSLFLVQ